MNTLVGMWRTLALRTYDAEMKTITLKGLCELMSENKTKKLAKGKPLALMSDKATELLIKASNTQNDESALDDADVIGYCKEWWVKYGESVPVSYSSMMRRLPNRLRLRSRLVESLNRLTAAGSLYFKYSYLTKNMVYHSAHIPVFGSEDIHSADVLPRELK